MVKFLEFSAIHELGMCVHSAENCLVGMFGGDFWGIFFLVRETYTRYTCRNVTNHEVFMIQACRLEM